jgi:hypothetical protein
MHQSHQKQLELLSPSEKNLVTYLNIPLIEARISILGLPSSLSGTKSYLTTLPVPSFTGTAPTKASTIAIDSPGFTIDKFKKKID